MPCRKTWIGIYGNMSRSLHQVNSRAVPSKNGIILRTTQVHKELLARTVGTSQIEIKLNPKVLVLTDRNRSIHLSVKPNRTRATHSQAMPRRVEHVVIQIHINRPVR